MPAPYIGHIDPAMQELHERLLRLQVTQAERALEDEEIERRAPSEGLQPFAPVGPTQAQSFEYLLKQQEAERLGRVTSLAERKQEWEEEKATWPTYATAGGVLLATYPTGEVVEAWKAPPTPMPGVIVGGALVDPISGEPRYAPPILTPTDTELIVTDRATGEEMNRIPIEQLPPEANFFADKYGNVVALDPQFGQVISEYTNPAGEELMYREAIEHEREYQLSISELAIKERAEERGWEQMYISKELAEAVGIREDRRIDINTRLTREGYDVQRDRTAITLRIAQMGDLTEREKMLITADLKAEDQRIESGRLQADIEAGKFMKVGDVVVHRNKDDTFDIAFKYPAENYPLTPVKIGDSKTGYKVGLIDPRAGTLDWLSTTPGGAAGDEEGEMRLDLLDRAIKLADPGNTFMTIVDPTVKAKIYRDTMALYGDLLISEMGYSSEEAARFSTPVGLWKALSDTTLSFGEERPEITPRLHEEFIREIPYGKAVPLEPELPLKPTRVPEKEKPRERVYDATYWLDSFKFVMNKETNYHPSIEVTQREMQARGLWDGPIDGIMTKEFERKFKIAFRRGKIEMKPRGE